MKGWVGTNYLFLYSDYNAPTLLLIRKIDRWCVASVILFTLPTIIHGQTFNNITKQPPRHPFSGFPYPQTWNEMNSSVSLSHEKPHQYPVQDGIKHELICKFIVLQINIPSASYIDFIFKHNRKASMSLVCLRKGHTFNCRACCRIIVH